MGERNPRAPPPMPAAGRVVSQEKKAWISWLSSLASSRPGVGSEEVAVVPGVAQNLARSQGGNMNSFQKVLASALLVCGSACAIAQVGISQTNPIPNSPNGPAPMPNTGPVRLTNESTSTTGTILHRDLVWNSKIPLNKTYEQFSDEEKAELSALYESMAP